MKKIIIASFLVLALFVGIKTIKADNTSNLPYDSAYQQTLVNIISLLEQQIAVLQQQVASDNQLCTQSVTPTPVDTVSPITPPQVFGGIPQSAPTVPTCSLTASTTNGTLEGSISWTSSNATSGAIYSHPIGNSVFHTALNLTPVSYGYMDGINFDSLPVFEAKFEGQGGECIATTTLQ